MMLSGGDGRHAQQALSEVDYAIHMIIWVASRKDRWRDYIFIPDF